jgi:predicted Zn-dependent peptidase
MFEQTTLPEGPRVITARVPGARSLSVAAYVLAGSRQEQPAQAGVAHFMEHLTFKGTRAYPTAKGVAQAIEGLGGTANAATDRESTVYWARLPVRHAARAFDVLAELIVRPQLRDADIARERDIIIDEIRSYRDDPGQYVFNLFDEAFYGDTALGREIAGDEETVSSFTGQQIRSFWSAGYRPANVVVSVAGDIDHATALELVAHPFGTGNGVVPGFEPAPAVPRERTRIEVRPVAQAHLCIGLPALPRDHPDQWALELLNAVLGEGSSSRLFQRVRERAALAYDVHSFPTDHADVGTLQVYAGVDPADIPAALRAILAELARLRDRRVPKAELDRARAYASGRLELRLEETRHLCAWLGFQEALHDRVLTLDQALAELAAVTPEDLRRLAERLIRDEALCLAVITPKQRGTAIERALRLP